MRRCDVRLVGCLVGVDFKEAQRAGIGCERHRIDRTHAGLGLHRRIDLFGHGSTVFGHPLGIDLQVGHAHLGKSAPLTQRLAISTNGDGGEQLARRDHCLRGGHEALEVRRREVCLIGRFVGIHFEDTHLRGPIGLLGDVQRQQAWLALNGGIDMLARSGFKRSQLRGVDLQLRPANERRVARFGQRWGSQKSSEQHGSQHEENPAFHRASPSLQRADGDC